MTKYEELMVTMKFRHMIDVLEEAMKKKEWTEVHRDTILHNLEEIDRLFKGEE